MTFEIALVLLVAAGALALFVTEALPVDVTALLVMVVLVLLHLAGTAPFVQQLGLDLAGAFPSVDEALSGLSNPATITVLCMFILSAGVRRTGIINRLGRWLFRRVGESRNRQMLAVTMISAPISGLINNTAAVAMLLPLVFDLGQRSKTPVSKLLIPLSYLAMMGGTLTLIGTSTNLLAAAIIRDMGGPAIGMFDVTPVGLVVLAVGTLYFFTIGPHLLPSRRARQEASVEEFQFELRIPADSPLIGQTVPKSGLEAAHGIEVRQVHRGQERTAPAAYPLEAEDVLSAVGSERALVELLKDATVEVVLHGGPAQIAGDEVPSLSMVLLNSQLLFKRRHLRDIDFAGRYGVAIAGVHRSAGEARRLGNLVLRTGQIVVAAGTAKALNRLHRHRDLLVLEELEDQFDASLTGRAIAIVAAVIAVAAFTPVPIVVSALAGVVAMIGLRCIEPEEAYNSVSWSVIFLLAGVIPLGIAMTKSGAAAWLAAGLAELAGGLPVYWVVFGIYAVTTLLTEIVSNNASVAILIPVALSVAALTGIDPLPLSMAVMFAASTSFMTPVGYQTNTMVYGSGVYRFFDFFRVGAPLNLLLAFVTSWTILQVFPA